MRKFIVSFFALVVAAGFAQKNIEFWYAFSDEARSGWIEDRMSDFNAILKDKGLDYQVIGERKGSYRETLQAAILAARQGTPPHLVQLFEVGSQLAVDSGIFEPVGNIGSFDTGDYIEPVLNYYTIAGAVNSIPFNSSSPILYANTSLMAAAGIESIPSTYGEVIAACEKIMAAGLDAKCIGFNLHSWFFEQWMSEQAALLVNNDNGRSARATETYLNSDAAKTIVNWIKTLNDNGYYTYTGKLEDWSGSDAIFTNQQGVFHITSTADLGNLTKAAGEAGFEVATGMLPIPDGVERNGVVIGGASVWLLKDHDMETLEVARDFALFMTNTENMVSWHKLTGYYPVRNSSVDALGAEGWFEEFPNSTTAFDQLLNTVPNTASAGALMGSFLDTRTIIEEAIQKVLSGGDVDEALDEAKVIADAKLTEYNSNF